MTQCWWRRTTLQLQTGLENLNPYSFYTFAIDHTLVFILPSNIIIIIKMILKSKVYIGIYSTEGDSSYEMDRIPLVVNSMATTISLS